MHQIDNLKGFVMEEVEAIQNKVEDQLDCEGFITDSEFWILIFLFFQRNNLLHISFIVKCVMITTVNHNVQITPVTNTCTTYDRYCLKLDIPNYVW